MMRICGSYSQADQVRCDELIHASTWLSLSLFHGKEVETQWVWEGKYSKEEKHGECEREKYRERDDEEDPVAQKGLCEKEKEEDIGKKELDEGWEAVKHKRYAEKDIMSFFFTNFLDNFGQKQF